MDIKFKKDKSGNIKNIYRESKIDNSKNIFGLINSWENNYN
jgi:hypothetical protein